MALPPPKCDEMGGFYLVFRPMELSAELGYTTKCGTILSKTLEVPYWTAPMTLSSTPLVTRLQERYCTHAWRLRASSRLIWLWCRGRVGRRARWALRHQPARGRAKRHRMVSSS